MAAATVVIMVIAGAFLMGCINSAVAYGEPATGVIHVGGKVLCQDCSQGYNEWVSGSKPLKGVKVSLTCMDEIRRRVMCYKSDVTDEQGQFDMIVEKYINGKELKPQTCWVRLVSSPDSACNVLTDFGGGKSGVKLMGATSIYRDIVTYMVGPFYYTTPMCEKPDSSNGEADDKERKASNY